MKKPIILLFVFFFALPINAQELTGCPAVVTININCNEPIITIRGLRNYNIYSITVDKVQCINVCEDFKSEFNEHYLMSCKYLIVCLDSSRFYQSKVDWSANTTYTIETDVGFGLGDLPLYNVGTETTYLADPYSIKICSWPALPQSIKGLLFDDNIENEEKKE